MIRNSGLRNGRTRLCGEDLNPIDGVGNLADIMLAFACGLMIAIIRLWGLDFNMITDIITRDELVEVQDVEQIMQGGEISNTFESKGTVYEDIKTGKLYIISP